MFTEQGELFIGLDFTVSLNLFVFNRQKEIKDKILMR